MGGSEQGGASVVRASLSRGFRGMRSFSALSACTRRVRRFGSVVAMMLSSVCEDRVTPAQLAAVVSDLGRHPRTRTQPHARTPRALASPTSPTSLPRTSTGAEHLPFSHDVQRAPVPMPAALGPIRSLRLCCASAQRRSFSRCPTTHTPSTRLSARSLRTWRASAVRHSSRALRHRTRADRHVCWRTWERARALDR